MIYAHGEPPRAATSPTNPLPTDLDPRVLYVLARNSALRTLLEGDAAIRTWAGLRALTPMDLHRAGITNPRAKHSLVELLSLRARYEDQERPEPAWATEMAPPPSPDDSRGDPAAWECIWSEEPAALSKPAPEGRYQPHQIRAIQKLGGRRQIRACSMYDLPKLKARFLELCRGAA